MGDLLEDIFDENENPYSRGVAAAALAFCVLFLWELFCAGIALIASIGSLTFGKALLYVNIFGFAILAVAIIIGAAVTAEAIKKKKEGDNER